MWSAAVIAGCCVWIASAQNALTIENVRPTFGSPGPDRAGALQVYPGDTLFISFALKGLQTNNQGQGKVRLEVEATDAAGTRVFRQDSGESTFLNALGGDSFHTNVRLDMGPKTAPGKYKVKVIATDLTSKANATRESDIEILPPGFAIVKVTAGIDQNLTSSASVFGVGQALYLGFTVVGYQNEVATKHPNLRLEMHSYDPYTFCLQNPPTASSWGTPADVAAVNTMYENAAAWQTKHQRRVLMGEAGCQVAAPSRADRLLWYQTVGEAQKLLSDSLSVWDDFGEWKIYDRTKRTFDAGVLSALGLSAASISQA